MMYKTFKYSHGKEKYTEILPEHFKKALLQFRIGSHKLPVNDLNTSMCLELIDIVLLRIVTNLLWGMKLTFYMNVQS